MEQPPLEVPLTSLMAFLEESSLVPESWMEQADLVITKANSLPLGLTLPGSSEGLGAFAQLQEYADELAAKSKAEGGSGKTLFGNFKDETTQTVHDLVQEFKKNNVHLAECALSAVHITKFVL